VIDVTNVVRDFWPGVSYGEIVYPPGSTYGLSVHPTIEVGFVYRGAMTAWLGDQRVDVEEGMACLVIPGRRSYFEFARTSETHHSWVHFWAPPDGHPTALLERLTVLPSAIRLSSALAREMRALLDLGVQHLTTRQEIEVLLAHRVLYQYIGEAELVEGLGVVHSEAVDRALKHIDEHLASPLDVDEIAAAALVSTSHLIRLFRRELGTTPARYLWTRRVERAVAMLEETGLTLGEIAHRCGFSTTHHFSRRVREATGLAPTAVRLRARTRATPDRT
jgi:AraC family transcriptional regulator of arabinose operon